MLKMLNAGRYTPLVIVVLLLTLLVSVGFALMLAAMALIYRSEANQYQELLRKQQLIRKAISDKVPPGEELLRGIEDRQKIEDVIERSRHDW